MLVELERDAELPLHEQVERSIRESIQAGRLAAGARLPSSRALAEGAGNLPRRRHRGLQPARGRGLPAEQAGRAGAGGDGPFEPRRSDRLRTRCCPASRTTSTPACPTSPAFPRDRWLRSLRAAWRQAPIDAVGYPTLAVCRRCDRRSPSTSGRVRGVAAEPEQMLICTGFAQAFSLLCRWLAASRRRAGRARGPGLASAPADRRAGRARGRAGTGRRRGTPGRPLEAARGERGGGDAGPPVPDRRVLSRERRAALVEWAEDGERLIVEDDFDAEYRYDGSGLGAVQGLAPDRVAYIGSASKRLTPGMRLGWALLPSWLAWPLIQAKAIEDSGSEAIGQLALHDFIERGELDRHIRRMRLRYQRRREAMLEALSRHLPQAASPRPPRASTSWSSCRGIPTRQHLSRPRPSAESASRASPCIASTPTGPPGLVLGFACLSEPAIDHGIRLLADCARDALGCPPMRPEDPRTAIVTCMDARLDAAGFLDLWPEPVHVIRNAGRTGDRRRPAFARRCPARWAPNGSLSSTTPTARWPSTPTSSSEPCCRQARKRR